jgi:hypothetical protein
MPRKPRTRPKSDAARRAVRTLFQVGTITALIQLYNVMTSRPLTADQVAAVTTVGTLLVSFLQNLLEQEQVVPEMMKGAPSAMPPPAETDDLTRRELNALATAIGDIRLQLHDLKPERRPSMSGFNVPAEDVNRISTRQEQPIAWPPGGLG